MADVHSKEMRSYTMSQVKGKNTKPELLVRKYLFSKGFRYRLHDNKLPGKPDIVLPKYKTVILVHGCFWHGHKGCKHSTLPKTRIEYWNNKINNNINRDTNNLALLNQSNWNVITIWECEIKELLKTDFLQLQIKKAN
ncbi:MAG: very short patch repair endonuclease [Chitinophagales bacterium]